ncbi:MAG: hypothetical protein ACREIV_06165, partial [Planctomycetaceae bacterium]
SHDFPGIRRPRSAALAAAACALLFAAGASAQVKNRGITGGLESGTDLVSLPASPGGSLTVRECRDCPTMRLEFDEETRYFIGEEPVSYAALRKAASKGDRGLLVSYRFETRTLTRLRLSAAGNAE